MKELFVSIFMNAGSGVIYICDSKNPAKKRKKLKKHVVTGETDTTDYCPTISIHCCLSAPISGNRETRSTTHHHYYHHNHNRHQPVYKQDYYNQAVKCQPLLLHFNKVEKTIDASPPALLHIPPQVSSKFYKQKAKSKTKYN